MNFHSFSVASPGAGLALHARSGMSANRHNVTRPGADPCRITERDLDDLPKILELLGRLNDPYAGGDTVARLVESIRVLKARCMRNAGRRFVNRKIESLGYALNLIGNRGLEAELFELLEEMTVFKSELESRQ